MGVWSGPHRMRTEHTSDAAGGGIMSRRADGKGKRKQKNVRYFDFRKVSVSQNPVAPGVQAVNVGKRRGRFYRRATEGRAVLERTRSNRFSRWFCRRPSTRAHRARVAFPFARVLAIPTPPQLPSLLRYLDPVDIVSRVVRDDARSRISTRPLTLLEENSRS